MTVDREHIKNLLELDQVVTSEGQNFGYKDERFVYEDPSREDQRVVKISTDSERQLANPNAYEEVSMAMQEVALSAKALIDSKDSLTDKAQRKKAVDKVLKEYQAQLLGLSSTANLFESKSSETNKTFLSDLAANANVMSEFMDVTCSLAQTKRKVLDAEGHKRRSSDRPSFVQEMKVDPHNPGRTHFIMYIPAGRYTKRQRKLRALQGHDAEQILHSTTSHQKKGLVHGNSSFVRMVVGTKESDGNVTILSDSFSGPGARMPYKDLNGADKYKRMAVKSITFLNQEEVVQALAQRVYDQVLSQLDDEGIRRLLATQIPDVEVPECANRDQLVQLYFAHNDLFEVYTQVTSPSQANWPFADGTDANREQFEFVRDAVRAFSGAKGLPLEIDDGKGNVLEVSGNYQGRHGAFGVNWFKTANDSIAKSQNTRFFNQMVADTVFSLQGPEDGPVADAFAGLQKELARFGTNERFDEVLNDFEPEYSVTKAGYREAMMDYQLAYQALENAKADKSTKPEALRALKSDVSTRYSTIEKLETSIGKFERYVDDMHAGFERSRKRDFQGSEPKIREQLAQFKKAVLDAYPENIPKYIQSTYNRCKYLVDAQSLYYSGEWAKDSHNFELQTLVASLATELGHANTKSCKSNNDRGQRLAQKIAGTTIVNSINGTGLYDGEYFSSKQNGVASRSENVDAQLMAIQSLHHTANTAVGGGKFAIRNKEGFADNGLLGKVASFAKLNSIGAAKPFYRSPLQIVATILTGGLFLIGKAIFNAIQGASKHSKIVKIAHAYLETASAEVQAERKSFNEPKASDEPLNDTKEEYRGDRSQMSMDNDKPRCAAADEWVQSRKPAARNHSLLPARHSHGLFTNNSNPKEQHPKPHNPSSEDDASIGLK